MTIPPAPIVQGYTTIDQLCCPHGHPLKDAFLSISERPFRCPYKSGAGARECGEIVWVLFGPGPLVYVASVTFEQLRHMKEQPSVFAILAWMGAPVYPVVPRGRAA